MNKINKLLLTFLFFGLVTAVSIIWFSNIVMPSYASAVTIIDGDIIQNPTATGDAKYDVYIVKFVNDKKFKRLILNPQVFESYDHLKWGNIKSVSQSEIDSFTTSSLVRIEKDSKIYALTPNYYSGDKKWIDVSSTDFIASGVNIDSVYTVNNVDANNYVAKEAISSLERLREFLSALKQLRDHGNSSEKSLWDITFDRYKNKEILLFIDSSTYESLKYKIERYKQDVKTDIGADVIVYSDNWITAEEIRNIIKQHYSSTERLLGSLLVGEIPLVYIDTSSNYYSEGILSDWYYQDMDNDYIDTDGDGIIEVENGVTFENKKDVWSSRLLSPAKDQEGIAQLQSYFDKNHSYRQKELIYKDILYLNSIAIDELEFSEAEYEEMFSDQGPRANLPNDDTTLIYSEDPNIRKQSYLQELIKPYRFTIANLHGNPNYQQIGTIYEGDDLIEVVNLTKEDLEVYKPNTFYTQLLVCSNGDFSIEDYVAGMYLFYGNSIVVEAATENISVQANSPNIISNYKTFPLGVIAGEAHLNQRHGGGGYSAQIFGDPTIRLNDIDYTQTNYPEIQLSNIFIDFGTVNINDEKISTINISNIGIENLEIEAISWEMSLNEKVITGNDIGFPFGLQVGINNGWIRDTIDPGNDLDLDIVFTPKNVNQTGIYYGRRNFVTNDPANPYIHLEFLANVIQ